MLMTKFRVIAGGVLGLNNRLFKAGEECTSANFPEGNAMKLVNDGFLEIIDFDPEIESDDVEATDDLETAVSVDELNKKQIIEELKQREIEFDSRSSKEDLLNLLKSNI